MEKTFIVFDFKAINLARCDTFQKMDNLLLHLLVIRDENVLTSTFDGSSPDHVETHTVADADSVGGSYVLLLHAADNLNDLLGVSNLAVSDQDDVSLMIFHVLVFVHDVNERCSDLGPSEVGSEALYLCDRFLQGFVSVRNASGIHSLELCTKTDDIVDGIFRERFEEENERLIGLLYSGSAHGA